MSDTENRKKKFNFHIFQNAEQNRIVKKDILLVQILKKAR